MRSFFKFFILSCLAGSALMISGCGSKKYYSPEMTHGDRDNCGDVDGEIVDALLDGVLLDDGRVIGKTGVLVPTVSEGMRFIGQSGGWLISGDINGTVLLQSTDSNRTETFRLKKTVAAASVRNDTLAVLFASNEMALYSLDTKALLYKERASQPVAVDSRIINPAFLNELVLFLTLDGKRKIFKDTDEVIPYVKKQGYTVIDDGEEM